MTARRDDQSLPLDEGNAERTGRPPRDNADDGKTGGASQGGKPSPGMGNATKSDERDSPGISTDKKADDTK